MDFVERERKIAWVALFKSRRVVRVTDVANVKRKLSVVKYFRRSEVIAVDSELYLS